MVIHVSNSIIHENRTGCLSWMKSPQSPNPQLIAGGSPPIRLRLGGGDIPAWMTYVGLELSSGIFQEHDVSCVFLIYAICRTVYTGPLYIYKISAGNMLILDLKISQTLLPIVYSACAVSTWLLCLFDL